MGIDVGVEEGGRIEVTFEEVNNENISIELVDNPITIELNTPGNLQVSFNEQIINTNETGTLNHDLLNNKNLNKQHTAETIQESDTKRFTSNIEISNLEPKRGVDDFYITNAEKTQGALATGVAAFPTVKDGISRIDRLLVDYTVPSDTPSLTFDRDKNGVLFSDLDIKAVKLVIAGGGTTVSNLSMFIKLNNITPTSLDENYIVQTSSSSVGWVLGLNFHSSIYAYIDVLSNAVVYQANYFRASAINPLANNTVTTVQGLKYTTPIIIKISTISLLMTTIKADMNIKIYRND